ncbi:hypothetical protein [Chelativorans alearense]|uniref:hypothetical protein n=1 Tax=Chelativorans alearense TaxID=2681495 RepID=UPI0013D0A4F7|nr:hypothetical protein [Chelativorans alearense]
MRIVDVWRAHRILFIGFALGLALTGLFLVRTVVFTLYWADPAHHEQAIEGWMPMRYVARSWDVPPEVLADALDVEIGSKRRLTVAEVAAESGSSIDEVAETLYASIRAYRSSSGD